MKTVLWVTGEPGSGKSCLARELGKDHGFDVLSVDKAYVEFVQEECPMLFFEALCKYIAPHYLHILSKLDWSEKHFNGRDFVTEWHEYLFPRIEELATQKDRVVVEGYLLKHCNDYLKDLREKLQGRVQIFHIQVAEQEYSYEGRKLTVEQIAKLGSNAPPEA